MPQNAMKSQLVTAKQERFITVLLQSPTQEAACKRIGISHETARRWLKLPHVQAAYQRAQQALFNERLAALRLGISTAMATLARNMREDAPPAVQVRAAQIWLEQAIAVHKMSELEARLAELEARLNERQGPYDHK
jgi:phage terminase small subunit